MGPANKAQRVRYDVASEVLRSQDLFTAGATPNPLSSNVVNMKLLYGIDPGNSGTLTWVTPTGPWAPATVMGMTASQLNQIKAVRPLPPSLGPRRQRGVVLFVALIIMVAMSLAAVALIRSVDTTSAVIGNLAFRQASVLPANMAVENAAAALFSDADPAGTGQ